MKTHKHKLLFFASGKGMQFHENKIFAKNFRIYIISHKMDQDDQGS